MCAMCFMFMDGLRVDSDRMVKHNEMVLPSISPHAQKSILSRIHKHKDAKTSLFATPVANKRVSLNSRALEPATENRDSQPHHFKSVQCSEGDSCKAEVQCATTKLHTPQWFTPLTHRRYVSGPSSSIPLRFSVRPKAVELLLRGASYTPVRVDGNDSRCCFHGIGDVLLRHWTPIISLLSKRAANKKKKSLLDVGAQ